MTQQPQTKFSSQCMAFVGLAQACSLVHNAATGREPDPASYSALYQALLLQSPAHFSDIFTAGDFSSGKAAAIGMLGRPDEDQIQALRYALAVIDATNRLRRHKDVVERLGKGIQGLALKADSALRSNDEPINEPINEPIDEPIDEPQNSAPPKKLSPIQNWDMPSEDIARLYVDTLGSLDSRIQVTGNASILKRLEVASKIRSLLLMGVRFAWLWHQQGGRRWHILTHRSRIRSVIESLEI